MKKIITILLICSLLFLGGCETLPSAPETERNENSRFERIEIDETPYFNYYFYYWRDTYTNIIYIEYHRGNGNGSRGGFTPLLNSDGTPMLYEEFLEQIG
jgi:hypothetical protein